MSRASKHNNRTHTLTLLPALCRNRRICKSSNEPGRFACTSCHRRFARKSDWKRHESSQCSPQTTWVCMLGDAPAIPTLNGWSCAFCDVMMLGPDPITIFDHLEKAHRISKCSGKAIEDRSFKRKDKLKSHLRNVHGLSATCKRWEGWHKSTEYMHVSGWNCSFCGIALPTWEGECLAPMHFFHIDLY